MVLVPVSKLISQTCSMIVCFESGASLGPGKQFQQFKLFMRKRNSFPCPDNCVLDKVYLKIINFSLSLPHFVDLPNVAAGRLYGP